MRKIFTLFAALTMVLSMFAATETVYFVNASSWTGTINAYAWTDGGATNQGWPGVAAAKEAEQIEGYDVYSYTAEAGAYAKVIFNNGSQQTADLVWTAGKYYVKDGWYTKEEAEAKLAAPAEYESVYFVDNQGWGKANIYTWTPEVGTWPGVAMTKEADKLAGYDVYSYTVEKGTSFGGMLFNNANGVQTGDLKWTAGKYYVKDGWYTKEEAEAKLSGPVTPPVISYVLMGVAGDWTTGIALTANPDNANEYVLLGQEIAEGDAVKVVTLTDGTATAWCGNVDEYSVAHSADDMGNIVLAPGKYDFYYKVTEDIIYIGGEAYPVEPEYNVVEDEITNLMIDMESMCIIGGPSAEFGVDVFLALTEQNQDGTWALSDESSVAIQGVDATFIDGYAYDIDVYAPAVKVVLRVEFGGSNYELHIDMVSKPVVIEIADAIVSKEEYPDGMGGTYTNWTMDGQWSDGETTYPVLVDMPDFDPTIVEADMMVTITIGSWLEVMYGAAEGLVHATVAENVVTLTGTLTSYAAGTWEVTISGTLPGGATTALDNIDATVAPAKAIVNGQLVITKDGVQYNAAGAQVK